MKTILASIAAAAFLALAGQAAQAQYAAYLYAYGHTFTGHLEECHIGGGEYIPC